MKCTEWPQHDLDVPEPHKTLFFQRSPQKRLFLHLQLVLEEEKPQRKPAPMTVFSSSLDVSRRSRVPGERHEAIDRRRQDWIGASPLGINVLGDAFRNPRSSPCRPPYLPSLSFASETETTDKTVTLELPVLQADEALSREIVCVGSWWGGGGGVGLSFGIGFWHVDEL